MMTFWILAVCVAVAAADYDACPEKYKCHEKPGMYYQCSNGHWISMKCPYGLKWDMYKATCNYPGKGNCNVPAYNAPAAKQYGPDCKGKSNYYMCHDKSPGLFWQCSNGLAWEMNCPKGLHFDIKKTACVYPKYSRCGPLTSYEAPAPVYGPKAAPYAPPVPVYKVPDCNPKKDYYMCHDHKEGLYWQCGNGLAYEMACPKGLVFNTYKLACTYGYEKGSCGKGHGTNH